MDGVVGKGVDWVGELISSLRKAAYGWVYGCYDSW